jgi:arylsulfatase A-like enzyme/Flp pilus assembly protein TadD
VKRILVIAAASAALLAAAFGALRLGRGGRPAWKGANVLFVTVDTLRADRLPAYGRKGVRTPALDALATRAAVFERAYATTPLTLPSHTTIFSGTYPLRHGVRDNGGFLVPAGLPLLAEHFRARDYQTAAFVAAFVLDSRWGLDRGFDVYHDDFDTRKANLVSIGDIERPGGEVVDAALAWLDRRDASRPYFLWVHLFDPHAPYAPPPPFAQEYAKTPYLGEIAYVDAQLARLFARAGENTAIVFAGDHGESFGEGEHGEIGHGMFVYQETLHVPLFLAPPKGGRADRRPEVVSLADVAPTVVELAGLEPPAGMQGTSLAPLLAGKEWTPRPAYAETLYPFYHFGWSPLATIQDGKWKLIESSDPELYDLEADPGETRNLAAADRDRYLELRRRFSSLTSAWSRDPLAARGAEDPEAARKLASLGYLTGGSDESPVEGAVLLSPRGKMALYNKLNAARSITDRERFPEAERALREILAEDPGIVDARIALANVLLKTRREAEAIPYLKEAARRRPSDATLVITLALAQSDAEGRAAAEATVRQALDTGHEDARYYLLLGSLAERAGDRAAADRWNARALELEPRSASLHSALAETLIDRGDLEGAARESERALELDPKVLGARYVRARILERRGDAAGAFEEYGGEIAVNAIDERSFRELARLAPPLGRQGDALGLYEDSIELHPDRPLPYLYTALSLLASGRNLDRAVQAAELGLARASIPREQAFAYFLLADLYSRLGDGAKSREYARLGRSARPPA